MQNRFATWLEEQDRRALPLWSDAEYISSHMSVHHGDSRPYFAKVDMSVADGLTVWLTNFAVLWTESFSRAEFEERLKKENRSLEADAEAMMKEVREMVLGRKRHCRITVDGHSDGNQKLRIQFISKVDEIPFKWQCILGKADPEEFYNQITKPMLSTISQYQRRESALVDLLTAKDHEIEQKRILNRSQGREKVSETPKFRFHSWSANDIHSKEFLNLQRTLRPQSLSRYIASNEVYSSVCVSEIYLRENSELSSDDDGLPSASLDVAEPNSRSSSRNSDKETDLNLPDDALKQAAEQPSSRATEGASAVEREPSPPSPPPQKKRKQLRL